MASIFPDESLDLQLGIFPKNGTNYSTLYIGFFSSQTATTVPARTAVGGATPSGWTETTGTSYARQSIAAASWGAAATNGNGRRVTAGEVTFPAAGSGGWGTITGFFIATASASGASDKIIYFSNFASGTSETINAGTVVKITPSIQYDGV